MRTIIQDGKKTIKPAKQVKPKDIPAVEDTDKSTAPRPARFPVLPQDKFYSHIGIITIENALDDLNLWRSNHPSRRDDELLMRLLGESRDEVIALKRELDEYRNDEEAKEHKPRELFLHIESIEDVQRLSLLMQEIDVAQFRDFFPTDDGFSITLETASDLDERLVHVSGIGYSS